MSRRIASIVVTCCLSLACTPPAQRRTRALELADLAVAAGDSARAEAELRRFLAYAPRDVPVATRLASLLDRRGRSREAAQLFTSLPDDVVMDAASREVLAAVLIHDRQLRRGAEVLAALEAEGVAEAEIVDELVRALARRGGNPAAERAMPARWRHRLVEMLVAAGSTDPAAAAVLRLAADDPHRERLRDAVLERVLTAGSVELLRRHPGLLEGAQTPAVLLASHQMLVADSRWGAAQEIEKRFLDRYGDHPQRCDILLAMTRRLLVTGTPEAALERADEALRLDPRRSDVLVAKALALRLMDRDRDARAVLEMVLDVDPDNPTARRLVDGDSATSRERVQLLLTTDLATPGP
jgi:predicted Zn-dependent protease